MPTTTLEPASEVSRSSNWSWVGGSSNYTNLKLPDNDDTSYANTNDNTGEVRVTLDDLPGSAAIIQSVLVTYRYRAGQGTSTVRSRVIDGGGTQSASTRSISSTSYADYDDTYATAFGSVSWTVGLVNGADLSFDKTVGGSNTDARLTSFYMDVSWAAAGGGSTWLIGSWLPPLIAAASHGLSLREIAFLLRGLKHRPSGREEFDVIRTALRVRPVYG